MKEITLDSDSNPEFKNFLRNFKEKYYQSCYDKYTEMDEINLFRTLYFPILEGNSDNYIEKMIRKKSYKSDNFNVNTGRKQYYISHVIEYIDQNNIIQEKVLTFILREDSEAE